MYYFTISNTVLRATKTPKVSGNTDVIAKNEVVIDDAKIMERKRKYFEALLSIRNSQIEKK